MNLLAEDWYNVQLCKGIEFEEENMYATFQKFGYKISCSGCLFSHLAEFIVNKEDEWFNPKVLDIKRPGLYKRYFDEKDYEDDFIFLNKLRERLNFLIKGKYVSDCSMSYVARSKFIYSDKRKTDKEKKEYFNKLAEKDVLKDYSSFNELLAKETLSEELQKEVDEFSFKSGIDI